MKQGADTQIVENTLAKAEAQYALALEATIASLRESRRLCAKSLPAMAEFIAVQIMRSLEVRIWMEQMDKLLGKALDQEGAFAMKAKYQMSEKGHPFVHAMLILRSSQETKSFLLNHIWIGARNVSNRVLITSDSPITRIPHIENELAPNTGIASPGIEVFFPLSPNYGVVILERQYHSVLAPLEMKSLELTLENVEYYNGHQVLQSGRQLFSNERAFEGVRELLSRRPDVKDPKRQRSEFIWAGRNIRLDEDGLQ